MKKLLMTMFLLICAAAAYGQEAFEIDLGTYTGAGKIAGKQHTVNLKVILGNIVLNYGGAVKCITLLRSTDTANLYEEIDQYDGTGKVAKDSCKQKGFVYFEKSGAGLIYHWGETKEVALKKPEPVNLKKAGANSGGASQTVKAPATGGKSALGNLLLELESNIKWEAVEGNWKKEREAWTTKAAKATTVAEVSNLLLQLESNIKWESVGDKWAKRRDAWVKETGNAANATKLAALLAEFETALKWTAVEDNWKNRRTAWTGEVKKAKN